jgi:preprotein translocase subunit SecE
MSETDQLRTKKMAKEKKAGGNPFVRELFQLGVYKRSQGKIARQITGFGLALLVAIGAWRLSDYLRLSLGYELASVAVPVAIVVIGVWVVYRLVNTPNFADFLIAVEAEMNKVSWPSRGELFRSSVVVIFSILFLATILFAYDVFWRELLNLIGVVRSS